MTNEELIMICKGWRDRSIELTEKEIVDGAEDVEIYDAIIKALEQQQKVGKWIKTYEPNDAEPFILWECSECKNTERGRRSKYCPNCGAKMI